MGKLYVVATPIGNLSDISQRALDVLRKVDVIAAEDTRRTLGLLSHFGISVTVVSNFKHNEQKRARQLIDRMMNEDISVALVSDAGTPCISDPGSILIELARKNNIEVLAIPGASAVMAALSVSGFNFTNFEFLGFIPRANKEKAIFFKSLSDSDCNTFVLFESPNRITSSLKEIAQALPTCALLVINDITKFHEKSYWGGITDVINAIENFPNSKLGEYTIVVHKAQTHEQECGSQKEVTDNIVSIEALLINEMINNNITLKEAATALVSRGSISRNDAYKASLTLKKLPL